MNTIEVETAHDESRVPEHAAHLMDAAVLDEWNRRRVDHFATRGIPARFVLVAGADHDASCAGPS